MTKERSPGECKLARVIHFERECVQKLSPQHLPEDIKLVWGKALFVGPLTIVLKGF